jgi:hypothetical protein
VLAPDGSVLLDEPDDGTGGRPEVQRGALRQILLDALPADAVRWGHKAVRIRTLGGGRHDVTFADGATVSTGLLIGADGAWSRVRALLSDATPAYVGTSFIETYLYDADTRHPASAKAVGGAHPDDPEAALTEYEQALFPRSADAAIEATRDFDLCFGDDAPRSLINLLTGHDQTP